jgi:outer membrane receptor protein involved in Fe transport
LGCGGGADILRRRLKAGLTYFAAELTDEIVGAGTTVVNQAGVSDRRGVELTLAAQVTPNWLITGSYAYTDATDPDGREEIRTPPHGASLGVHHTLAEGRAQIGATAIYNGRMKDDSSPAFSISAASFTPRLSPGESSTITCSSAFPLRTG